MFDDMYKQQPAKTLHCAEPGCTETLELAANTTINQHTIAHYNGWFASPAFWLPQAQEFHCPDCCNKAYAWMSSHLGYPTQLQADGNLMFGWDTYLDAATDFLSCGSALRFTLDRRPANCERLAA